jgi:glycerophosphoryl diester phosphodiesterase
MRLSPTLAAVVGSLSLLVTALPVALAGSAAAAPSLAAQDPESVLTVAHRGARYVAPENTLVALRAAIDRGADFVEVDVQRSKDGRLVLVHDNDLARTTNVEKVFPKRKSWAVADVTYRDMRKLDAGSWKAKKYAGERIPTLKQALRLVQRTRTGIMIELKSPELYPGLESEVSVALRQVDGYLGRAIRRDELVVQSFDFDAARAFEELEPRVKLALLGTPDPAELHRRGVRRGRARPRDGQLGVDRGHRGEHERQPRQGRRRRRHQPAQHPGPRPAAAGRRHVLTAHRHGPRGGTRGPRHEGRERRGVRRQRSDAGSCRCPTSTTRSDAPPSPLAALPSGSDVATEWPPMLSSYDHGPCIRISPGSPELPCSGPHRTAIDGVATQVPCSARTGNKAPPWSRPAGQPPEAPEGSAGVSTAGRARLLRWTYWRGTT